MNHKKGRLKMGGFSFNWFLVILYVVLNATGAITIKHKLNQLGAIPHDSFLASLHYLTQALFSYQIILGFLAIFGSAISWIMALSRLDLNLAYPLAIGLNFLFILLSSIFFFGEPLSTTRAFGIALMFGAIYFIIKV